MEIFPVMYLWASWLLPAMILGFLGFMLLARIIEFLFPSVWKRVVRCPRGGLEVVRLEQFRRFGAAGPIRVVACTVFGPHPVVCDQACLKMEENQPTEGPAGFEREPAQAAGVERHAASGRFMP